MTADRREEARRDRSLVFVDGALTTGDRTPLTAKGVWKVLNGGG
jgi:hypothetical protein